MRLRAGLNETMDRDKQAAVDWVFDTVARRYDLGNDLMSAGMHRRWKRRLLALAAIEPHHRVLDLACGTGDVTWAAALAAREGEVVGADNNEAMLALAEARRPAGSERVRFVKADALALPFESNSFDRVLCSYAGRGLPELGAVAAEVYRVLAPGGEFWNLDFARPPNPLIDSAYRGVMTAWGAVLGTVVHGDPRTYVYIPLSMARYRGQRWLHGELERVGFAAETHETALCLMAYNRGVKPARAGGAGG